jgi:Xaa-Pro aminopeptidase
MQTFFEASFFTANRSKLQAMVGEVPIVITASGTLQRAGDEAYKFQQDSNFWYLTGIVHPDIVLVITPSETYLIVPTLSFERQAFDGAIDIDELAKRSGITYIVSEREGWAKLKLVLGESKKAATLAALPSYMKRHRLFTAPYRRRLIEKLKRVQPGLELQDIRMHLAELRSIKQPQELAAIQQAIDITTATIDDIRKTATLEKVAHEYELEAAITYGFRSRGAEGHAFSPIVGAGKHTTTLHHVDNNGPVTKGDLIVIDIGADVEHYAADITRTIIAGPVTARQAVVHKAVLEVQEYALLELRPGVFPRAYEKAVEIFMGEKLRQLGLIHDGSHEMIRHYFPHATSHFMGLDVHDVGDYSKPLAPGMVVTCEPGIYIPEEGIGVRIEDDVLITETGNQVLSKACSRTMF